MEENMSRKKLLRRIAELVGSYRPNETAADIRRQFARYSRRQLVNELDEEREHVRIRNRMVEKTRRLVEKNPIPPKNPTSFALLVEMLNKAA
jgi:hypothetical protein